MSAVLAPPSAAAAPARRRATRVPLFAGAATIAALHWLDAALLNPWAGEPAVSGAPAAAVAVLFTLSAWRVWPRLPRGPKALAALLAGVLALVSGALAIWQLSAGGSEGGAYSGVLMLPAGAVMLACAVLSLRGGPPRPRPARWARRALGTVVTLLSLLWIAFPVGAALYAAGKPRAAVPAGALGIPHETVTFASSDGLRLSGWYVPSRNRAAVLLVHGGGGSRLGAVRHARLLARHGFGVLLYDARGRGASQGAPDAIGWTWQRDVAGALAWLRHRPDVDPAKIGALGLSTGAEAVLQAAARRRDLHAVVADGAEGRTVPEVARVAGPTDLPYWAALYAATGVLTATAPPPDLGRLVGDLHAPALLIGTGRGPERRFNQIYARRSRGHARLWLVPDAGHTQALRRHPAAYAARVLGFLDAALHPRARLSGRAR
jgi:fermentation-respiration switch protein FrsA (DUF1100 family)